MNIYAIMRSSEAREPSVAEEGRIVQVIREEDERRR
jgi:hypothetical protein